MTRNIRTLTVALAATAALAPVGVAVASHHHHHPAALWAAPTGSGTACTYAAPCSLTEALATAPAHATVRAMGGTYAGGFVVSGPVDLVGSRGAVIDAATSPSDVGILIPAAGSGSSVRGFRITGATGAAEPTPVTPPPAEGAGIRVIGASHVTIADNTVTGNVNPNGAASRANNPSWGIWLMSASHSTVADNRVWGNDGGVYLTDELGPNSGNTVRENVITANTYACGITLASHHAGTVVAGVPNPATGGVFGNLVIGNVADGNGTLAQGAGVLIGVGAPGGAVYNNRIVGNTANGNGLAGVTIHQHFAVNSPFPGATPGDANGNVIVGNRVSHDNVGGDDDFAVRNDALTGITVASVAGAPITGTVIKDNRIRNVTVGIWLLNAPTSANTVRHNRFGHSVPAATRVVSQTG